jgi:hypothetical protein
MKPRMLRVFVGVTFLLLVALSLYVHFTNTDMSRLRSMQDPKLNIYNETSIWVMQDIQSYLEIDSTASLQHALHNSHMTAYLQKKLFPTLTFNSALYPHYSVVKFIDDQFSFESDNHFQIYLLADVGHRATKVRPLNIIVFVSNNQIYNVVAY